jgi:superfamily I DNA/RNA helicase
LYQNPFFRPPRAEQTRRGIVKTKGRLLEGLNAEQRLAVTTIKGPVLVLAGAGTGKTRVITYRIAHMIAQGIPATSILAMTFTNKAAGEMKERIAHLVPGATSEGLTVGTFHSFCVRALRQFAEKAGVRRNFGICDADDQLVAVKQAMRHLRIPELKIQPRVCLAKISLLKNRLIPAKKLIGSSDDWEDIIGRVYEQYDRGLHASGVLDFDDLLLYMVKLLKDPKTLQGFQKRYQHLLIDEYQDTNGPQYEIVRQIGGKHQNVCVVGDDDQSIYGWRGADVSKILNFEKDFPKAVVVRLETNYRSTHEILAGANAVIRNNGSRHEKTLRSAAGNGAPIRIMKSDDEEMESTFVVEDILERVRETQSPLGEFAILFRTQVQPRLFEMQLRQRSIPYNLVGGLSFFDRKEVRDVLAYLRLIANPTDELSLLRVINTPPRGVGLASVEKALAIAAEKRLSLAAVFRRGAEFTTLPSGSVVAVKQFLDTLDSLRHLTSGPQLVELVKCLLRDMRYGDEIVRCYPDEATRTTRWEAINEIMNMVEIHVRQKKQATLTSFLDDLTISANEEAEDETESRPDRITLMTLHSAKGLEFGEVYLVGMEEGLLPHAKSIQDGAVEEERRLAYVGITRARRRLTLTYTGSRARYGQRANTMPSRFLYELRGKKPPVSEQPPPAPQVEGRGTPMSGDPTQDATHRRHKKTHRTSSKKKS